MKLKNVFFFSLIYFYQTAICQPYQSLFGNSSTSWNIYVEYFDASGTDSVYVTGDTLINGYSYKAILDYGFLREDSALGKAWIIKPFRNDASEHLVMDLSLSVGDSFLITFDNSLLDTMVIVDSVYFVNNIKYVRFNYAFMHYNSQTPEKLTFIEGIGTNAAFFYSNGITLPYLLCSFKDGIKGYANRLFNGECFVQFLGINDNENLKPNCRVYPNPFSTCATLSLDISLLKEYDLTIHNIFGQTVRRMEHLNASDLIIRKEELHSGTYFFRIEGHGKIIATGKLLIE